MVSNKGVTPMLKIITTVAAAAAVLVIAIVAYAATRPDRIHIQRSMSIKASADTIFPMINDLRAFNTWNPFDKKDPNIKGTYTGPQRGKGAGYAFDSGTAGTGTIEIVDTAPAKRVTMKLVMTKPMHADNRVEFTLEPEGDLTRVTWAMDGEVPFLGKVLSVFCNMDTMVGQEFEAGLADLKTLMEKSSVPTG
jgi:hypothetical protein